MIEELIKKHGAGEIGRKLNETPQAVNNWKTRGIPVDKTIEFCKAIDFEKTPHEINPRQYPHPDDGLPDELRGHIDCSHGRRSNDRRARVQSMDETI